MTTKSSTTATDSLPAASQISGELTTGLASADGTAAERVQNLQWVHQARVSQLSRTAASMKAQYGPDNPEVKAAEAAVTAANVTVARVSMAHQQLTTVDPQVAQNGWALHGRVFDAQLQPVSGFTVFLVDANKTYQQAYGFAYTDDTGYFLLKYVGPDSASQDKSQTATQAATTPQLFIEIADTKALPIYLSTAVFQPVAGTATYENITLPDGDQPIGDPPPEIRNIALPAQKKKKKA
ncbi:MAG TPA: hypothetical protein VNX60_08935 [Candidatus Acidoferrum sp.]|jgi:hypothetical protein|nr:hypothetical protein [Candidatus Acidoferrum sp.]